LHRKAGNWLEQHTSTGKATAYACMGGDVDKWCSLLEQSVGVCCVHGLEQSVRVRKRAGISIKRIRRACNLDKTSPYMVTSP
jgi:ATP/maltotriose-dependent transcriptional regulator MalT